MKKVYIHVGLPKTGTTDLQTRIFRSDSTNYQKLIATLPVELIESVPPASFHFLYHILTSRDRGIAMDLLDRLDGWLATDSKPAVLFCSELLAQTPVFDGNRVSELFGRLAQAADIEFILVLRPYFEWLESFINQLAKTGYVDFDRLKTSPVMAFGAWQLNYLELLQFYEDCVPFRKSIVHVVPYGPMVNERILEIANIQLTSAVDIQANASMSAYDALTRYFEIRKLDLGRLPQNKSLRFVGIPEVAAWHGDLSKWADPLASRLQWPKEWLDDSLRILQSNENGSYVSYMGQIKLGH
ncbi:MAG: hypothetical protein ABI832_10995 [bacterium]